MDSQNSNYGSISISSERIHIDNGEDQLDDDSIYTIVPNSIKRRFSNTESISRGSGGLVLDFNHPILQNTNIETEEILNEDLSIPRVDKLSSYKNSKREFRIMIKSGIPIVLTSILAQSLQMASVFSLGHLGKAELAAASLASMTASITALSISMGASSALDTLCSQAWGAGRKIACGLHLQRMIILHVIFYIGFVIPVWFNSEWIFNALGQGENLSANAALYLRYLSIGAPGFMLFECIRRYLQAQGIMHASTYCLFIVAPLNAYLNFSLVHQMKLGLAGAAIATSCAYWGNAILLILYIIFVDGKEGWGGFNRDVIPISIQKKVGMDISKSTPITGWKTMIKLTIPGIIMCCSDWWSWEVAALAASLLGEAPLAAQAILLTSCSFTWQSPYAIGVAATNRIGNLLGAGYFNTARIAAYCGITLGLIISMINSGIILIFKDKWGYLFNSDPDVIEIVTEILPLAAAFQISDGLSAVLGGCMRGLGKQGIGGLINMGGYYIVGIPLGMILCFYYEFGLDGIWIGLATALFLIVFMQTIVLMRVDWEEEGKIAMFREEMEGREDTRQDIEEREIHSHLLARE